MIGVWFVFKFVSNGSNIELSFDVIIVKEIGKIKEFLCVIVNKGNIVENEVVYKVFFCGMLLLGRFVRVEMMMEDYVKCSKSLMCLFLVMNLYEVEVMMGKDMGLFREIFF